MSDEIKNDIIEDDYEFTRQKLKDLIDKGSDAFESMMAVAKDSEHPRAYEVLSGMMKNIGDMSEKLIDIGKKKKEIQNIGKPQKQEALPGSNTTNNVFIGSTAELQKMLQQQKEENIIDIDSEGE